MQPTIATLMFHKMLRPLEAVPAGAAVRLVVTRYTKDVEADRFQVIKTDTLLDSRLNCYTKLAATKMKTKAKDKGDWLPFGLEMEKVGLDLEDAIKPCGHADEGDGGGSSDDDDVAHPPGGGDVSDEGGGSDTTSDDGLYHGGGPPAAAAAAAAVPDNVADEIADPAVEVACLWGYWWWECRGHGGCSDSDPGGHISWKASEFCTMQH